MVTNNLQAVKIKNNQAIKLDEIPVLSYKDFYAFTQDSFQDESVHCVAYYAFLHKDVLKFICCLANDSEHIIYVLSHEMPADDQSKKLKSLTKNVPAMHIFEREIWENHGVVFEDHPWLKPVRFSYDRHNPDLKVNDYPFYKIQSDELHEVGVGPIHAGVIEPGHFRFTCNGEMVLHLEIQLGWQHRGIEKLFLEKNKLIQRFMLAESIAGDTAIGHTLAFSQLMEALGEIEVSGRLETERSIALELERIAIHTGDMSALCTDIAYQLGYSVFATLRTAIINLTQAWGGNRLGKGLIRAGGNNYTFTEKLADHLHDVFAAFEPRFDEMADKVFSMVSLENRFKDIGTVTSQQAHKIGAVGMVAKMAGVKRDIRSSHPFAAFKEVPYEPIVLESGDVYSRFLLRRMEIRDSIRYIKKLLADGKIFLQESSSPVRELLLNPSSFSLSMTEGWRGEICHCAVTDENGDIAHYKIKDPSMHNWKSLELSLRNLEISDFPINNKSYSLSYCGHDL